MNKMMLMAVLLAISTSPFAASLFSPTKGVVCDKKSNFCVDEQGISMGLTTQYLGSKAQEKLQKSLGDGAGVSLGEYTLSNGVHCDSKEKQCYTDRYYPRKKDKQEPKLTTKIFGKSH
ncbi:Fels-1 Prophage Protein-like [Serratia quinivorans]|uniref:YcgJ family protein n=1 Tax=Serratia quinivorans TaxID=137545 RepID=UPI0021799E06|nr:YcgJ family protein [Serratia quinivorans]CAI1867703.1 Fels-1 Prophage Protein-like [Serratia quinivorans]